MINPLEATARSGTGVRVDPGWLTSLRPASHLLFMVLLASAGAAPLRISVSVPPLLEVVRSVAGADTVVTSFMGKTDDPHTFSPTPKAVAQLGECEIFFTVGMPFEEAVAGKIRRMFPDLTVVDAADGLDAEHEEHDAHHGHKDHGLHDPHIWLSLPNLTVIAANVRDALAAARPDRKEAFFANCERLVARYQRTHAELKAQLRPCQGATFFVYHPAFGHFARDYGLHQSSVEIDGKSPSPKQLLKLTEEAQQHGVKVIFVQPQFNIRPAKILADRINGRVVVLDPMGEDPGATLQAAATAVCAEK